MFIFWSAEANPTRRKMKGFARVGWVYPPPKGNTKKEPN